ADPAGRYVRIQVSNPGQIPDEILAKLTEPFFTTKSRGTGLGLAIVKRILDAHDGQLEIRSDPVRGVCVAVTLPAAEHPR
ncbi:MAG: ATP-binding protein, partial [Pseudomonadota bacterium]|nr:ATP-binding protein [Pseudomonadota bacterium]